MILYIFLNLKNHKPPFHTASYFVKINSPPFLVMALNPGVKQKKNEISIH